MGQATPNRGPNMEVMASGDNWCSRYRGKHRLCIPQRYPVIACLWLSCSLREGTLRNASHKTVSERPSSSTLPASLRGSPVLSLAQLPVTLRMSTRCKRFFLKAQNSCFTNKPLKPHHFLPVNDYKKFTTFKMNLNAK